MKRNVFRRVLLTGGAGFLGSHVAERLAGNCALTVLDDLSTGRMDNLPLKGFGFVRGRAWSQNSLGLVKNGGFDLIIHLAANGYIPASVAKPYADFENNVAQPLRLLETLRLMNNPPAVMFASSAAVHGTSDRVLSETDVRLNPVSPYGAGKLSLELYARRYAAHYGVPTLCVRFFPMYGPRQTKQVVYDLMKKIRSQGTVLEVFGSGMETRDLLYVADAADGVAHLAGKMSFEGGVINLCTGRGTAIKNVARLLCGLMSSDKIVRYTQKLRPGDVDRMVGSTRLLAKSGFRARTRIKDGLLETVRWFDKSSEL